MPINYNIKVQDILYYISDIIWNYKRAGENNIWKGVFLKRQRKKHKGKSLFE
jgi:hypothetical protein